MNLERPRETINRRARAGDELDPPGWRQVVAANDDARLVVAKDVHGEKHPVGPRGPSEVVFDDESSLRLEHPHGFAHHRQRVGCVMQHVADGDEIEARIFERQNAAVVADDVNPGAGLKFDVDATNLLDPQSLGHSVRQ